MNDLSIMNNETNLFCSFDLMSESEKRICYNALTSPDKKLSACINMDINIVNFVIENVEIVDKTTGALVPRKRVILIDDNGVTYTSISSGIFNALNRLCFIYGMGNWNPPLTVKVKQIERGENRVFTLEKI